MTTHTSAALRFDTNNPGFAAAATASGLSSLTEDEIAAVAGGIGLVREGPVEYAAGYWITRGVVGTLQDFVWQLMN